MEFIDSSLRATDMRKLLCREINISFGLLLMKNDSSVCVFMTKIRPLTWAIAFYIIDCDYYPITLLNVFRLLPVFVLSLLDYKKITSHGPSFSSNL